ncbi:hypothetical protein [Loktanella sp. R86503]|uniref:hypothetical protein n=1 Tax=Loktanella sp. R86503 TaxID=3093847 RepID=UPI0036D9AB29
MADQLLAGIPPVFASNGEIVAGGTVAFYETGTLTPVAIWADRAGEVSLTNPVTLDAQGRAPLIFYTGSVAVKEVIKNAAGVTVDVIDPSPRFSVTSSAADGVTASPRPSNTGLTVQEQLDNVSDALATFADTPVATVGGGTANAISLDSGKSLSSVATGQRLSFIGALDNTDSMMVTVDGLPAVPIKTVTGANTPAKYVRAGVLTEMHYDGAQWIAEREKETITLSSGVAELFEDGVMRATSIIDGTTHNMVTAVGATGLYTFASSLTWVYPTPVSFTAAPAVSGSMQRNVPGSIWGVSVFTRGVSESTYSAWGSVAVAPGVARNYSMFAVGKWY